MPHFISRSYTYILKNLSPLPFYVFPCSEPRRPDMTSFSTTDVVLVTGGNGYVAQHVISQLLSLPSGPKVRATVRSTSSITTLSQVFSLTVEKGQLEVQIVEDITIEGAFDNIVRGVTHIAHIASPIILNPQSIENDLLIPAIKGTTSILISALLSPTLKSVVITSSSAAVFDPKQAFRPGYTYSSKDWNPLSYSEAADPSLDLAQYPGHMRPWITYFASKKLAEELRGSFTRNTILHGNCLQCCPLISEGLRCSR